MKPATWLALFAGILAGSAVSADDKADVGLKWEYRVLTKNQVLDLGKSDLAAGLDKLGAEGWELAAVEGQYIFKRVRGLQRRQEEEIKRIVAVAESDAEAWRDRVTWAERMVKKGYLTERQLESERAQLMRAERDVEAARKALQDLRSMPKPPGDKGFAPK